MQLNASTESITADRLHLTNIINNLLDNALKYCDKQPEITLATHEHGGRIYLSIQDNGIGISKQHHKKVFNKFYRVPTGNVHDVKGFGLGLFYIKRICQAHRWKLFLDSTPGESTVITIGIPIKKERSGFFSFFPFFKTARSYDCLLYTSPSPRD